MPYPNNSLTSPWVIDRNTVVKLGIEAALLLEFFRCEASNLTDDFVAISQDEIKEKLTLSPHKQRKALSILKENKLIEVIKKDIPARNFYKLNHEKLIKGHY